MSLVFVISLLLVSIAILPGCTKEPLPPEDSNPEAESSTPKESFPSDNTESNTLNESSASTDTEPEFADADYQGASFVIRARSSTASSYASEFLVSDDPSDIVKSEVIKRNDAIKKKYNVTIEVIELDDAYSNVDALIETGDIDFDVLLERRSKMATLATKGSLYDFNKLKNVNLKANYWDANAYEQYTVNGKLFFMPNDISTSNFNRVLCLVYNRDLINDYKLQDPQKLVEKNEWTLEEFLKLSSSIHDDNGDGIWTVDDVYGLFFQDGGSTLLSMLTGCGVTYTKTNAEGMLSLNIKGEKTEKLISKIRDSLYGNPACASIQQITKTGDSSSFAHIYDYARNLFANGHALFIWANPSTTNQFAGSNFGLLPNPKESSEQKSYYHRMDGLALIWAIPNTSKINYEKVANVFEYGGYTSSKTVMQAYYETVLQGRRVKTSKDAEILDLIKNTIRYEITDIFSLNVSNIIDTAYTSGNISSTIKSMSGPISKKITKLYEDIGNLK